MVEAWGVGDGISVNTVGLASLSALRFLSYVRRRALYRLVIKGTNERSLKNILQIFNIAEKKPGFECEYLVPSSALIQLANFMLSLSITAKNENKFLI